MIKATNETRAFTLPETMHVSVHYRGKIKGIRRYQKGHAEIITSEDRQYHGQQNEMKHKHRTHNTTLNN